MKSSTLPSAAGLRDEEGLERLDLDLAADAQVEDVADEVVQVVLGLQRERRHRRPLDALCQSAEVGAARLLILALLGGGDEPDCEAVVARMRLTHGPVGPGRCRSRPWQCSRQ
jgi:hypothetical protein